MNRYALAAAAILLAAPAVARDVACAMTDRNGNDLLYGFSIGPRYWVEYEITKNGAKLIHEPGSRPRWPVLRTSQGNIMLTYAPDPRYKMAIGRTPKSVLQGVRLFPAGIIRSQGAIDRLATGACAFLDEVRSSDPFLPPEGAYE